MYSFSSTLYTVKIAQGISVPSSIGSRTVWYPSVSWGPQEEQEEQDEQDAQSLGEQADVTFSSLIVFILTLSVFVF